MSCAELQSLAVRIGSRDTERTRVLASVDALCGDFTCLVLVLDLSATGARIEAKSTRFCVGDVVRLRLPFLPAERAGEIAWSDEGRAGVQFFQPLDSPTYRILSKVMRLHPTIDGQTKVAVDGGRWEVRKAHG